MITWNAYSSSGCGGAAGNAPTKLYVIMSVLIAGNARSMKKPKISERQEPMINACFACDSETVRSSGVRKLTSSGCDKIGSFLVEPSKRRLVIS